jgi:hypothetical protein
MQPRGNQPKTLSSSVYYYLYRYSSMEYIHHLDYSLWYLVGTFSFISIGRGSQADQRPTKISSENVNYCLYRYYWLGPIQNTLGEGREDGCVEENT